MMSLFIKGKFKNAIGAILAPQTTIPESRKSGQIVSQYEKF